MEQAAIEAFTPSVREAVFRSRGIDASNVVDLGGFESFVFHNPVRDTIVRVTHRSHREREQLLAEVEWIADLFSRGAAVSKPVPAADGNWVEAVDDFFVCEFHRAPGRLITEADWNDALLSAWGESIGRFHRLASDFSPVHRRIDWTADENFAVAGRVPADQPRIHEAMAAALSTMRSLPVDAAGFGLIHCDAHAGNFFIDDGRLTFFDFDDACYCWYGYDITTVLFGAVRQSWMAHEPAAETAEAARFLPPFLEGYAREYDPAHLMVEAWPLFLKVREIGLYGVILSHEIDVDSGLDDYPTNFMRGRRERIEAGEPYLDLDFASLF